MLDSPFSDILEMVKDIANDTLHVPGFIITLLLKLLSKQIEGKVGFDIMHIKPVEFAKDCTVPCVFISGA